MTRSGSAVATAVERASLVAVTLCAALVAPVARAQRLGGPMVEARAELGIAALADGRVLVAGGRGPGGPLASAELFDRGRWRRTASVSSPRAGLRLTVLEDGRVLATGGGDSSGALRTAEVWDPRTERWTPVADLRVGRTLHVAALLADGRVLVAGGAGTAPAYWLASAEIWDPTENAWITIPDMTSPRSAGSVAVLEDGGRVLVSGSHLGAERSDDLDLWDSRSATWTSLAGPLVQIEAVVALDAGRALVLGHARTQGRGVADARDPRVAIWSPLSGWELAGGIAREAWPRFASVLTLDDGRVVVAGGMYWDYPSEAAWRRAFAEACEGVHIPNVSVRDVFVFRPDRRSWSRSRSMRQPRSMAGAVPRAGGEALVVGGEHYHYSWGPVAVRRSIEIVRP
jgi:hypothetical protein